MSKKQAKIFTLDQPNDPLASVEKLIELLEKEEYKKQQLLPLNLSHVSQT